MQLHAHSYSHTHICKYKGVQTRTQTHRHDTDRYSDRYPDTQTPTPAPTPQRDREKREVGRAPVVILSLHQMLWYRRPGVQCWLWPSWTAAWQVGTKLVIVAVHARQRVDPVSIAIPRVLDRNAGTARRTPERYESGVCTTAAADTTRKTSMTSGKRWQLIETGRGCWMWISNRKRSV